jgi:osmoprotectant transport system permease protein
VTLAIPTSLLCLLAMTAAPAVAAPLVRVGSKSFTESVVLGEVVAVVCESTGAHCPHQRSLGGTRLVWSALRAGHIDVYPEYTGTLLQEILGRPAPAGVDPVRWLRQQLEAQGVGISEPLGFNNTYALGMRADVAGRLGIRRISDLTRHPQLRFGFSSEFMNRKDGWPGLRDSYRLPQQQVRGLEHDLAYRGLASGSLDLTDLYVTDAEIRYYRLFTLEDDRFHFPDYQAVLVYRLDTAREQPAVFAALGRLAGKIDAAAMTALNARAKLDKVAEPTVAAQWAAQQLGLAAPARNGDQSRSARIAGHAREHLQLTGLSLLAAIVVAVPLGVLAARRPRLGQGVLALVGIIQTIPSLALLVFMIPLLGIGALPAAVALFLYSLLPIVRNTHAGLLDIPLPVRESAEALGLAPRDILFRIELPLASRAILAGIKSAAVINVGTATLGALIGAGGFGQPIFTGIRLDDVGLILEGAIPASLLALAVQGAFEIAERVILPRGLRLTRS